MKVKVISLPNIFQVLYVFSFTWTRYQVSVYRTIGPLVYSSKAPCKRLACHYLHTIDAYSRISDESFASQSSTGEKCLKFVV